LFSHFRAFPLQSKRAKTAPEIIELDEDEDTLKTEDPLPLLSTTFAPLPSSPFSSASSSSFSSSSSSSRSDHLVFPSQHTDDGSSSATAPSTATKATISSFIEYLKKKMPEHWSPDRFEFLNQALANICASPEPVNSAHLIRYLSPGFLQTKLAACNTRKISIYTFSDVECSFILSFANLDDKDTPNPLQVSSL
jgi:hypothetical protein